MPTDSVTSQSSSTDSTPTQHTQITSAPSTLDPAEAFEQISSQETSGTQLRIGIVYHLDTNPISVDLHFQDSAQPESTHITFPKLSYMNRDKDADTILKLSTLTKNTRTLAQEALDDLTKGLPDADHQDLRKFLEQEEGAPKIPKKWSQKQVEQLARTFICDSVSFAAEAVSKNAPKLRDRVRYSVWEYSSEEGWKEHKDDVQ